jgi:acetolactate synthase I/III small subunit
MKQTDDHTYALMLTVRNSPGVLVRCAQVFARRGHNIESLSVAAVPNSFATSHMTITAYGKEEALHQITQQLKKLIDVINVVEKEL